MFGVLVANCRNFRTIFKQIYNRNWLINYLGIFIYDAIISSQSVVEFDKFNGNAYGFTDSHPNEVFIFRLGLII